MNKRQLFSNICLLVLFKFGIVFLIVCFYSKSAEVMVLKLVFVATVVFVHFCEGQRGSLPTSTSSGSSTGATDASGRSVASDAEVLLWANALPADTNEYKRVLKGEDGRRCRLTDVIIDVENGNQQRSERQVKRAIAKAIANSYDQNIPTFDAAKDSAEAVLNVYASSIGKVTVTIESSNGGCWGIGFGRATARAYAEGTATAIASALSKSAGKEAKVEFDAATKETATNVSEVIDSVAALIGVGNGTTMSMFRQVRVEAKVNVMACAIARAYAAAKGEDVNGVAAAFTGCTESTKVIGKSVNDKVACRCKTWGSQPRGCGRHGVNGASDFICYVANPLDSTGCACGQDSTRYRGQKWRYCGSTLGEMQVFLNTQDNKNGIQPTPYTNGFCGNLDSRLDK
eukprot:TRINITY_DN654_c0_g3_i1.p1 TRINITY_DN654_c0_g3~~TRINITY_DN654_c0_g3_i1.p1  ORF type:complete len:400 (+),score=65.86 TRINITY_DN654_c0_g3_i1:62-1261(+)